MTVKIIELVCGTRYYSMNLKSGTVVNELGQRLDLTDQNWRMLKLFVDKGADTLLTTDELINEVWSGDAYVPPQTVGQAIRTLRKKFDAELIETVHGRGFKLLASVRESEFRGEHAKPEDRPSNRLQGGEHVRDGNWTIYEREQTPGLAELRLHQPRPGNEPGTFYLDATLRVAIAEYELDDRTVVISLASAFMSIEAVRCQPTKGSMLGERTVCPHITAAPLGVNFTPIDGQDCLTGNLLADEHVAVMESTEPGDQRVTIELRAGRRGFLVQTTSIDTSRSGSDAVTPTTTEKTAILNELIYKLKSKDGQGRVVLASARMEKRAAP